MTKKQKAFSAYAVYVVLMLLVAAALAGCSGASRTCDDVSRYCLTTFRDGGSGSSVTAFVLFDADGQATSGKVTGAVQPGWVSQINPISALAPSTLQSVAAIKTLDRP